MKPLRSVPLEIQRRAWKRAKAKCERCGMPLLKKTAVHVPAEMVTFRVKVWDDYTCYRCHSFTRVVMVFSSSGEAERYIEWKELGEAVRRKFSFFQPSFSETMESTYYANRCVKCGAFQGDHYLLLWVMDNGKMENPNSIEDLPGVFSYTEPENYTKREFLPFKIARIDPCPKNKSVENLIVLCLSCYEKDHSRQSQG